MKKGLFKIFKKKIKKKNLLLMNKNKFKLIQIKTMKNMKKFYLMKILLIHNIQFKEKTILKKIQIKNKYLIKLFIIIFKEINLIKF